MSSDLNVVLGATGGLGRAVVAALTAQGQRVRAVSRKPGDGFGPGVEVVAGDVSNAQDAVRVCAGAGVVYFAAQPPYGEWPALFPPMTASVIGGAAAADARLILVDNLYMYGPTVGVLHEGSERQATGPKGRTRIAMETMLLDAHREGRVRVAIGRLSDYFGPNGLNSTLSALVLEPALKGKAMRWPGSVNEPRTVHYLPDAAHGLVVLGNNPAADGSVWHLPSSEPITGKRFMELVNDELPARVKEKSIGTMSMKIGGLFSKEAKESVEVMYQWTDSFISEDFAFRRTFGTFPTTPHQEAVRTTVEWMSRNIPTASKK